LLKLGSSPFLEHICCHVTEGSKFEKKGSEFAFEPYILVAEDEPIIRMLAIVADAGFEGIEAANADEAVYILESRNDIRIAFADIDMPGDLDGIIRSH
jgi:hypothetical protein